jgi:hypothetical protein
LLEEPRTLQRLSRDPIQQESINLRANWLHQIASEAVASGGIDMPETEAWVEAESGYGKSRL